MVVFSSATSSVQPSRRAAKERGLLLQIDVHSAKENGLAIGLIFPVHSHRQIKRQHRGVMPQFAQRRDECVVVETIPTKHAAGAGSELNDVHAGCVAFAVFHAEVKEVSQSFRRQKREKAARRDLEANRFPGKHKVAVEETVEEGWENIFPGGVG